MKITNSKRYHSLNNNLIKTLYAKYIKRFFLPMSVSIVAAKHWWKTLEPQWQLAFSQGFFREEKALELPADQDLLDLRQTTLIRLAGPLAFDPITEVELMNLSGVAALKNLTYLSITNMQLTSLEALHEHIHLAYLYVYNNQLTDLNGVENMLNLKELYCQHNQIDNLLALEKLTNLEVLYASDNAFSKVEGITLAHEDTLTELRLLPNKNLKQRELIRVQNELGMIVKKG